MSRGNVLYKSYSIPPAATLVLGCKNKERGCESLGTLVEIYQKSFHNSMSLKTAAYLLLHKL